ncbi:MAG: hypothetical protein RIS11_382, partial [Pseudomonadota bacterium]
MGEMAQRSAKPLKRVEQFLIMADYRIGAQLFGGLIEETKTDCDAFDARGLRCVHIMNRVADKGGWATTAAPDHFV